MNAAGLRIGITLGLRHDAESVWSNGIKQNAVFLVETLRRCSGVRSVVLVNATGVGPVRMDTLWDSQRWPIVGFEQAKDSLDVLIELGGQVDATQTDHLKQQGTRLVSYCCGSEYVVAMESVLFGKPSFGLNLFVNQRYDDIWMVPQVAETSESYFSTLRRRPARVVPFVWAPYFLDAGTRGQPHGGVYRPRSGPRRLSVMEPNINVVKFCLYPILIAEEAFRLRPDLISFLHVTNADHLASKSDEFIALMNQLEIVRAGKASFVGRYETPRFLAEMTDVVISHQWGNPLNYFYLEVCWQGYPLVHNATLCSELGYYYPGNNVGAGCLALLGALQAHDQQWESYLQGQRRIIGDYLPDNRKITAHYECLLTQLIEQAPV